jgi:arginine utilization protein RocB
VYQIRLVHLFDLSREATSMVYYRDKRLMIGADALMKPSDFFAPTRDLTIDLVAIPSVTGSSGETTIVEYLHHRLTRHKAYQSGRMRLFMIPSKDDPLFRPTLIAHLVGKKPSGVLLFGHTDTVGTSDYGALESLACRPLELTQAVSQGVLGPEAAERAKTGSWLFGRGSVDMKSGVAAALTTFEALADSECEQHVFFSATPDEEVSSLGVKTLSGWLDEYLEAEGIELKMAINTDYTSPLPGDGGAKHIYLGSIGKLLLGVYVRGVPSHAAEPENGLDPNVLLANITGHVVYNDALRDTSAAERCPAPTCLFQRDGKSNYDVQTALSASAYYNLFHMERTPSEQLTLFVRTVRRAIQEFQTRYPAYSPSDIPVYTYEDLWNLADDQVRDDMKSYHDSLTLSTDVQERSRLMTETLLEKIGVKGPCVVVYFAAGLIPKVDSGVTVAKLLTETLHAFSAKTGEKFKLHTYFPYISDLSFLTASPDWEDATFVSNYPCQVTATPGPRRTAPTLMIGTYGVGAHRPDESVEMTYTFRHLPSLLWNLVKTVD